MLAILLAVMVLNLLAMLQIPGAVLGVLQVALAVEMILRALHQMNLLTG